MRLQLWLNGICAIRTQPLDDVTADWRYLSWINVFGAKADIRTERA